MTARYIRIVFLSVSAGILCGYLCRAGNKDVPVTVPEEKLQIDSAYLERVRMINDYDLIGLQYGVSFSTMSFQPTRSGSMTFEPINVGILYTHYCKLFGYMPYFGIQLGAFYTQEAYHFKTSDSGYTDHILGAAKAEYKVLEIPALAHLHFDFWKMKVMADFGIFGGYRMTIHRDQYTYPSYFDQYGEYQDKFHPRENRWDFGLKGGLGFGFILDPIEIHLMGWFKYSWSNMHKPNSDRFYEESKYYYYWTYPINIVVSAGIHYQLTKRNGITRKELRQEALREVLEAARKAQAVADSVAAADSAAAHQMMKNAELLQQTAVESSAENEDNNSTGR